MALAEVHSADAIRPTHSAQHIQLNNAFSIVSVQMHLLGSYDETPVDANIHYTRVWAMSSAGSLQMIAGHASVVST
ncbi:MAG: hypothetical protein AAGA75_15895 [Cyanobacteria bacterium P01_E01_bin.6]